MISTYMYKRDNSQGSQLEINLVSDFKEKPIKYLGLFSFYLQIKL
jgi:hypothetical protein